MKVISQTKFVVGVPNKGYMDSDGLFGEILDAQEFQTPKEAEEAAKEEELKTFDIIEVIININTNIIKSV
jgi:hypothetical protein